MQKTIALINIGNMKKTVIQLIIVLAITLILLSQINLYDIVSTLKGISPILFFYCFLFYIAAYIFRVLRINHFLDKPIPANELFPIIIIQGLSKNFLPGPIGEGAYLYLIKRLHNVSIGNGLSSLVLVRTLDLLAILLLFILSVVKIGNITGAVKSTGIIAGTITILLLAILLSLIIFKKRALHLFAFVLKSTGLIKYKKIRYMLDESEKVISGLAMIKLYNVAVKTFVLSIFIWVAIYISTYFIAKMVYIPLTFWQIFFICSVLQLVGILPIHFFGGLGTTEISWTFLLMIFGIPKEQAITAAFSAHIIFYINMLLVGGYGIFKLKLAKNKENVNYDQTK